MFHVYIVFKPKNYNCEKLENLKFLSTFHREQKKKSVWKPGQISILYFFHSISIETVNVCCAKNYFDQIFLSLGDFNFHFHSTQIWFSVSLFRTKFIRSFIHFFVRITLITGSAFFPFVTHKINTFKNIYTYGMCSICLHYTQKPLFTPYGAFDIFGKHTTRMHHRGIFIVLGILS